MYRFFSIIFVFVVFARAHGQFKGMETFRSDSLWQQKFRHLKVKSVTESKGFNGNTDYYTGHIYFDKKGKVLELCLPDNLDFHRTSFTYDNKGRRIKIIDYDLKDTSKINTQRDIKFDNSGNIISETRNSFSFGKRTEEKREVKLLQKTKNVRLEEHSYSRNGKIYNITLHKDSISEYCNFKAQTSIAVDQKDSTDSSSYGSSVGDSEESVLYAPAPSVFITRNIEWHCPGENIIYYITTVLYEPKLHYAKRDNKNRILEIGEILPATKYRRYTDDLISKLMKEPVKGIEIASLKFMYMNDLLVEENIAGAIKTYSYNDKRQLMKSEELKPKKETSIYRYNEQGLITEINSTVLFDDGKTGYKLTKYSYEYY